LELREKQYAARITKGVVGNNGSTTPTSPNTKQVNPKQK
jgi:hypothetical protein